MEAAGVARTKIAFVSDRDSQSVLGLVDDSETKGIYFTDYDGANVQRVTVSRSLNKNPQWAPDGDGSKQIWLIGRDGRGLRRLTRTTRSHATTFLLAILAQRSLTESVTTPAWPEYSFTSTK